MNQGFLRPFAFGLFVLASVVGSGRAYAFPANVRHGYPNCTACHLSPGGGGVLSAYGRELAKEIQSAKSGENEAAFAYGLVKTPEWLDVGGDFRFAEVIQDTKSEIDGDGIWMQSDFEAGVHIGKLTLDATLGWKGNSEELEEDPTLLSRRHYAMVSLSDRFTVRLGKFYPTFGIMQPEHEDATRAGLGFDPGTESYNFEFSDQTENGSFFVTPILGKLRGNGKADEKGVALEKNFVVGGNSRVGVGAILGKEYYAAYDRRIVVGPNAILSLSKNVFWTGEVDFERRSTGGGDAHETGIYQYQKLSVEPSQGLILSGRQDLQRSVIGDPKTSAVTLGPVVDWYPRPHLDLQATLSRVFIPEGTPNFWVYTAMLHFYL